MPARIGFGTRPEVRSASPVRVASFLRCRNTATWLSSRAMPLNHQITLDDLEIGQILDGLEIRAESWERTGEYLRTGESSADEFFVVEECSKPEEADGIAQRYRSIIDKIRRQTETRE